jgi:hypothetical protein
MGKVPASNEWPVKNLPCLVCGRVVKEHGYTRWMSRGGATSSVFDPMNVGARNGEVIVAIVCDPCLAERTKHVLHMFIKLRQEALDIQTLAQHDEKEIKYLKYLRGTPVKEVPHATEGRKGKTRW